MEYMTLTVTAKVVKQVTATGDQKQRQITIRDASPKLRVMLDTAREKAPVLIRVNGSYELSVGDTDAIWPKHQKTGVQRGNFDNLYALLSSPPDQPAKFNWDEA
jgi:hypothetical protein